MLRNNRKIIIFFIILIIILIGFYINFNYNVVFANTVNEKQNYSKEYQEYLSLSEEERSKLNIIPRMYDVPLDMIYKDTKEEKESPSLFNFFGLFAEKNVVSTYADEIPLKYDLRNDIDIKVENQGRIWFMLGIFRFDIIGNKFSFKWIIL